MSARTIYDSHVDGGAWHVTVEDDIPAADGYQAHLRVHDRDGTLVHEQVVGVAYQARFGPDMADVVSWQNIAIDVIDNPEYRKVP